MHTVLRFLSATWGAAKIMLTFVAWAMFAALAGAPEAGFVAVLFAAIFFAPAGFANAWSDFGDY